MEPTGNERVIYEFGRFTLDPKEKTLFADGEPLHLPAKEFETLLLLVENNRKALSKDEMIAAVWQDAFVEEGNLAKQISRLRKILNTNGNEYIQTIPKHGYRFSAEIRLVPRSDESPEIVERRTVKRMAVTIQEDAEPGGSPSRIDDVMLLPGARANGRWGWIVASALLLLTIGAGYFWLLSASAEPGVSARVKSLAVLPFKLAAPGENEDLLGIGMTDALITKLSNLRQTVVRPTSSVRRFADHDPLAAGRELGVDAVLTGNVQRADQQIRVTVQLVSLADGGVLWASKFDRQYTDVFEIQDSISEHVARSIEPGLAGEQRTLVTKRYTADPQAQQAYVRGRYFWNLRTADGMREAVRYLREAVERDPNYALAHAGLADAYSLLADYNAATPAEAYEKARNSALKALALDSTLAEAHTSLAYVNMYYFWEWKAADEGYKKAIELNPNYATAHQWYSEYLAAMGRFEEALVEIRRAKEVDPLSPVINAGEVWIFYWARRHDEAIEAGTKLAETHPNFAEVNEYLKRAYDQKGMYREAIAARQTRRKLVGLDDAMSPALQRAAAAAGRQEYWRNRLEQELTEAKTEGDENYEMAEIYAQLGETDKAFEWLEKAFNERAYTMMYLRVAPNLDPLRTDARFADILRRIGLSS